MKPRPEQVIGWTGALVLSSVMLCAGALVVLVTVLLFKEAM